MRDIKWDIRREGRSWTPEEVTARFTLTPEKLEVLDGRLLASEEQRLELLGLLLENVGLDAAVRFGDAAAWRDAIRERK